MKHLKKEIQVELLEEATKYFLNLSDKMQEKFLKCFDKTESGIKGTWFEKLNTKMEYLNFEKETARNFIEYLHFGIVKQIQKP